MGELRLEPIQEPVADVTLMSRIVRSRAVQGVTGLALAGAVSVGCGANALNEGSHGEVVAGTPTELPPYYQPTPPSSESAPQSTAPTTAEQSSPVKINPNLCKVISAEHIAKLLHVSTDSTELKTGIESCEGLDGVTAKPTDFIASAQLQTTATKGVYNNLYDVSGKSKPSLGADDKVNPDPRNFVALQKDGMGKVLPEGTMRSDSFVVNGGAGEMVSVPNVSSWVQVDINNGGQPLEFNFSVSPPVTVEEATAYIAGVEADILSPQTHS
jgi:hypothetical protein